MRASRGILATLETQQIRRMLDEGIQVLIFKAIDGQRAYPILKEAERRNVPIITLDQPLTSIKVRGHIAIDETRLGGGGCPICDQSDPL